MRVGLIGLGNLGTATANLIAGNGHEVRGWDHDAAVVREIADQGTNSRFLDGVAVHPEATATSDLPSVVRSSEVLFVAIPSVFIEPTLRPVRDEVPTDCLIVNMAKGIDARRVAPRSTASDDCCRSSDASCCRGRRSPTSSPAARRRSSSWPASSATGC